MGILQSDLFKNDLKLEACATSPDANISTAKNNIGDPVRKIQEALAELDKAVIDPSELAQKRYGKSTAAAVLKYKKARSIINPAYQRDADDIVGVMTIKAMDTELHRGGGTSHATVMDRAFDDSRVSLRAVQTLLTTLASDIAAVDAADGADKTQLMATFLLRHPRDVLVISRRLFVSADAFSPQFKAALARV